MHENYWTHLNVLELKLNKFQSVRTKNIQSLWQYVMKHGEKRYKYNERDSMLTNLKIEVFVHYIYI